MANFIEVSFSGDPTVINTDHIKFFIKDGRSDGTLIGFIDGVNNVYDNSYDEIKKLVGIPKKGQGIKDLTGVFH